MHALRQAPGRFSVVIKVMFIYKLAYFMAGHCLYPASSIQIHGCYYDFRASDTDLLKADTCINLNKSDNILKSLLDNIEGVCKV